MNLLTLRKNARKSKMFWVRWTEALTKLSTYLKYDNLIDPLCSVDLMWSEEIHKVQQGSDRDAPVASSDNFNAFNFDVSYYLFYGFGYYHSSQCAQTTINITYSNTYKN